MRFSLAASIWVELLTRFEFQSTCFFEVPGSTLAAMRKLFVLLLVLASGCSGKSSSHHRDPRFDDLAAAVEQERIASNVPGVSVALMQDGKVVWSEGFGSRLADANKPAKDTTLYHIGSCNKMLTSAALLRRVDDGSVALDDAVTAH